MRQSTSVKILEALKAVGAPESMLEKALTDVYHEMKSQLATPLIQFAKDAKEAGLGPEFHQRIVDGEFDVEDWEVDEWFNSDEGQETFRKLIGGE